MDNDLWIKIIMKWPPHKRRRGAGRQTSISMGGRYTIQSLQKNNGIVQYGLELCSTIVVSRLKKKYCGLSLQKKSLAYFVVEQFITKQNNFNVKRKWNYGYWLGIYCSRHLLCFSVNKHHKYNCVFHRTAHRIDKILRSESNLNVSQM